MDFYLGEIRAVTFNFAPKGWAICAGQLLAISQNAALYSVLSTTYGGNGTTNFALPDFRGRRPVHIGDVYPGGQRGGEETHALTLSELPAHTHAANAAVAAGPGVTTPGGNVWAGVNALGYAGSPNTLMAATALGTTGTGQPHENMPPYLVLNFVIALQGIYPTRP